MNNQINSLSEKEKELRAREKALDAREKELEKKEKALDPFSAAVKARKEQWYDRVKLTVRQMDVIIRIIWVLLGIVVLLIILEAAGILRL